MISSNIRLRKHLEGALYPVYVNQRKLDIAPLQDASLETLPFQLLKKEQFLDMLFLFLYIIYLLFQLVYSALSFGLG